MRGAVSQALGKDKSLSVIPEPAASVSLGSVRNAHRSALPSNSKGEAQQSVL